MDPDACLSNLLDAISENDSETAYDRATDLKQWLENGGFYPGSGNLRQSAIDDQSRSVMDWQTHLGICPDCKKFYGE